MTFCGTVDYVAPELIFQIPYDERIDIWAVGILAYELLTGTAPFSGANENHTYTNITSIDLQKNNIYDQLSIEAKDFIMKILQAKPTDRLSLEQMLSHPWLCETSDFNQME